MQIGRCALNDLIITLVSFASKNLRIGGRLVYWLPVLQDEYNETAVPQHDCFNVISNSEQKLAGSTSRRLITMQKIQEWVGGSESNFDLTVHWKLRTTQLCFRFRNRNIK